MLNEALAGGSAPASWTLVATVMTSLLGLVATADILAHRRAKEITIGDAAFWSALWIAVALGFYGWLRGARSVEEANLFLAGYTLEKTLSVDNLVVFIAIFEYFRVKGALQHRILRYGILGAVVLRLAFVLAGTTMLELLGAWADLFFGGFVLWSAFKMASLGHDDDDEEEESDYGEHVGVRIARRFVPVVPFLDGNRLLITGARASMVLSEKNPSGPESHFDATRSYATPALLCLFVIELSDVMFAFDSVPVVIAVTREPTLVLASMIFAIMGLRSLYFILAALLKWLVHLEKSVVVVLVFIGLKLLANATEHFFGWPHKEHLPTPQGSLVLILTTLGLGILASVAETLRAPRKADD